VWIEKEVKREIKVKKGVKGKKRKVYKVLEKKYKKG
jgi:hypothetical protein